MPDKSLDGSRHTQVDGASHPHFDGSVIAAATNPDPHGQAALLLVESLIHELVNKAVLSRGEAIDIIEIAADVEEELAHATNGGSPPPRKSPLAPLATSFRSELGE